MLQGPIVSTLCGLAWPNVLMMLAQSSTVLLETWFLAKLGTDALAGAALVVPVLMLTQNMSQGAMGGGISSAVARAAGMLLYGSMTLAAIASGAWFPDRLALGTLVSSRLGDVAGDA